MKRKTRSQESIQLGNLLLRIYQAHDMKNEGLKARLSEEFFPQVFTFLSKTGKSMRLPHHDVEDISGNVLINITKGFENLNSRYASAKGSITTWLRMLFARRKTDFHKARSMNTSSQEFLEQQEYARAQLSPLGKLGFHESLEAAQKTAMIIGPQYAFVWQMMLAEKNLAEMEQTIGFSKSRLCKMRNRLRELLDVFFLSA